MSGGRVLSGGEHSGIMVCDKGNIATLNNDDTYREGFFHNLTIIVLT